MTGKELIKWIQEHHAEELEILADTEEVGMARIIEPLVTDAKLVSFDEGLYHVKYWPKPDKPNAVAL